MGGECWCKDLTPCTSQILPRSIPPLQLVWNLIPELWLQPQGTEDCFVVIILGTCVQTLQTHEPSSTTVITAMPESL